MILGSSPAGKLPAMSASGSIVIFLTAFRKKSPILKECEGTNSTNE
ncbi:hypothetical protein B4099_1582 [Heyndrickxia coagulans]|uniref:Uncharacterized protein n=1 Tax=Heyndrickxia coagulans TaxID=1398 RepID=A0A150KDT6_HEYCO|nr:hypothetical protein B4099_1582 [Heyndrickxia coagulans]